MTLKSKSNGHGKSNGCGENHELREREGMFLSLFFVGDEFMCRSRDIKYIDELRRYYADGTVCQ
jgi:hypothetical protein